MQINTKEYDPAIHDAYRALSVKQPYADYLTQIEFINDGERFARKRIEVRSKNTTYRGDLLVCSTAKPIIPGRICGATCGLVELYDVKPVSELTAEEWEATCLPAADRERYSSAFAWMVRNPRRVVEMPIRGQLGIYRLIVPKGDITEYPQNLVIGDDGWEMLNK